MRKYHPAAAWRAFCSWRRLCLIDEWALDFNASIDWTTTWTNLVFPSLLLLSPLRERPTCIFIHGRRILIDFHINWFRQWGALYVYTDVDSVENEVLQGPGSTILECEPTQINNFAYLRCDVCLLYSALSFQMRTTWMWLELTSATSSAGTVTTIARPSAQTAPMEVAVASQSPLGPGIWPSGTRGCPTVSGCNRLRKVGPGRWNSLEY